jgi:hypothetical protein
MDHLRTDASQQVDEFLAGGDLGKLWRWVAANRRAVYASNDSDTQELVNNARRTIDGVLKGTLAPDLARDHLRRLIAADRRFDPDANAGGPSRRFA